MKKSLLITIAIVTCGLFVKAQDNWTNIVSAGFDNSNNDYVNALIVFKGQLYAGVGSDSSSVFRTSTGNPGSWSKVFSLPNNTSINAMNSTAQGGGYLYISSNACCSDVPKIFRSPDGTAWTPYYTSSNYNTMPFIFPFNGAGTVDSMYVVLNSYSGDVIIKSAYDSNDPDNLSASWDTVLDFSILSGYTSIKSVVKHAGKMYLGTTNNMGYYANLWSSADGKNWIQNISVGSGFGDGANTAISALADHAGYIYAGTANNSDGAQIWRSNDDVTWTKIAQYPTFAAITSIKDIAGTLWVTANPSNGAGGQILKSTNDTTFIFSNNNGFGETSITGNNASTIQFGNNIYWGGENYTMPLIHERSAIGSQGAQIWRLCTVTPSVISAGPDQLLCVGSNATFTATPGFVSYMWDYLGSSTSNILNTNISGIHYVTAIDANGCDASDTVNLNTKPTPSSYVINPYPLAPAYVCKGNTLSISTSSSSGIRNPVPPMSRLINDSILDYGTTTDSIVVAGITDDGINNTLVDITIDSLYHPQDGDLAITLIAPNGSSVSLSGYNGYGSQNYIGTVFSQTATNWIVYYSGPFTGTFSPNDPFSYLNGPTNGTWKIQVYDNYVGNQGVLKGWTLHFSQPDTNMTYAWTPAAGLSVTNLPNTIATGTTTTTYSLTVTNLIGCTTTDTVTVNVPAVHIIASNDSICNGTSTNLYVVGGYAPFWTPNPSLNTTIGDTVIATPLVNTMYFVHDTVIGCVVTDSITIYDDSALVVPFIASQTICHGDSVTLTGSASSGTAPYTYWWYDGASAHNGQTQQYVPLTTTTYTLVVTDAFMCPKSTTTDVNVTPSTDIYGHVNYSGGSLGSGTVVLYKYLPVLTHFDTLQTCSLVAGNYHFTAVDHAQYLIEVFADTLVAPLSVPTYYGDVFLWDAHPPVSHGCSLSDTFNITLVEIPVTTGPGSLHGNVSAGAGFGMPPHFSTAGSGGIIGRSDPIPGIDVKLGHNPGGQLFAQTQTDVNGNYSFNNLAFNTGSAGDLGYTVYVDIPGLARDSSYTVTVNAITPVYYYLDYIADSTAIYIVLNAGAGISNPTLAAQNKFNVYPNPFRTNTNIEFTLENPSNVSLDVYNVLGTKIKNITSGKQQAGEYKYNLNNQDANLNQGVYFIKLTIDGKSTTQRVMVIE